MNEALKQYYLQQLGIQTWVLRDPHASSSSGHPLADLEKQVAACQRCPLHQSRTQTVFARGNPNASLMIVGEAPGFHEDKQGLPFVGKAGHLLNEMLHSIGLSEQDVYIANVLKCRPPDNRDPQADEISQCGGYLAEQIRVVKPKLILAVGRFAGKFFANGTLPLHQMRHQLYDHEGIPVIVSYHPAYLLRNPADKKKAYQDLIKVKQMCESL